METLMAAELPQQKAGGLARRLASLVRRKRSPARSGVAYSVASDVYDESLDSSINSLSKLKLSGNMAAAYSLDAVFNNAAEKKKQTKGGRAQQYQSSDAHAFVAGLFAGVSAVKASYAQLQLAQHPYDADAIQSADAALVAELGKLSDHKRRYARDPAGAAKDAAAGPAAIADEQRHLIRTYEITARKLEAELRARDAEARRAREDLRAARAMEERVHPGRGRTLAALDDLHLSGLNATHFLTALRHAVKSVRAFARSMLDEMRLAGWDPAAAAAAVHPGPGCGVLHRPGDAKFALESFVALKMFNNFHRRDFGGVQHLGSYERRDFFEEFAELKSAPVAAFLDGGMSSRWGALGEFLRERYLSLVHERMEAAFFGRTAQAQRGVVKAGAGFPETAWFAEFAEMARRVWLLHCLFFAFEGEGDAGASIFQARAGERFSEVYMDSVSDMDGVDGARMALAPACNRVVGFTVVPGFKVGRSVMQCRVYLSRTARHP